MWQEIKRFIERDLFPVIWKYKIQLGAVFTISFWLILYFVWWGGFSYLPEITGEEYIFISGILFFLGIIPALLALEIMLLIIALNLGQIFKYIKLGLLFFKIFSFLSIVKKILLILLLSLYFISYCFLFGVLLLLVFFVFLYILPKIRRIILILVFFISLIVLLNLSLNETIKIKLLFLILWHIHFLSACFLLYKRIKEIVFSKEKLIDVNLLLITIYFSFLSVNIYIGYFARYMGIFTWKDLYLKGEYCYFLQEKGFIKKTDMHKIPINNNNKTSNVWCELKNAYIFWKDSRNIYVNLIKDKYKYSFPIKREFVLQEPMMKMKSF